MKIRQNTLYGLVLFFSILLFVFYIYSHRIRWKNRDAIQVLQVETQKWGSPFIISKKPGGLAIWTREQLTDTCFERIELYDESVPHCVPKPHRDFLYTFVKYDVTPDKFSDVLSLSGSVAFDPLKKELRARCGSQEANIATLYLATEIANGNKNLSDIQANKLYKQTIVSTQDPKQVEKIYSALCDNIRNQTGNSGWTGYWPAAFPEGCCKGYNPETNTCGSS